MRGNSVTRIKSLAGKTVLLTGAAGGIGSALARSLFLREGASLLLVDKDHKKLAKLKEEIENTCKSDGRPSDTSQAHIFDADLSSAASLNSLCERIGKYEVDILINNAAIVYSGSFREMEWEDFDAVLSINLMAAIRLTRLLLPQLIKNRGFIVNVASGSGLAPFPGLSAYTTSKFGLVGFSGAIRAELRGLVGVSTICPAFVATPIMKDSLLGSQMESGEKRERRDKLDTLFNNMGMKPERVANIIIKSIKKNKGLVPVGFVTHFLYGLRKFLPKIFDRVNAFYYRTFIRKGLLD